MLPMRQKPEDTFMTPTYNSGGSDSPHTRQGGVTITVMLVAMVLKLLGKTNKEMNRENKRYRPLSRGISINKNINFFSIIPVFSTPKVPSKP